MAAAAYPGYAPNAPYSPDTTGGLATFQQHGVQQSTEQLFVDFGLLQKNHVQQMFLSTQASLPADRAQITAYDVPGRHGVTYGSFRMLSEPEEVQGAARKVSVNIDNITYYGSLGQMNNPLKPGPDGVGHGWHSAHTPGSPGANTVPPGGFMYMVDSEDFRLCFAGSNMRKLAKAMQALIEDCGVASKDDDGLKLELYNVEVREPESQFQHGNRQADIWVNQNSIVVIRLPLP